MHYIISFESRSFDLVNEIQNPINPIHGKSIGDLLYPQLTEAGAEVSEIDAEDWGWYYDVSFKGQTYMVGFVGLPEDNPSEAPELIIQIEKLRSFIEKITSKNTMDEKDHLLVLIQKLAENIGDITNFNVRKNA